MRDPLIVRLLIPLGIAAALFFLVDFALTLRVLKHPNLVVGGRGPRRTKILGLAGILLITILSIVTTVTFQYRRTVSERGVQAQESANPTDTQPRQALRRQVRAELLAFFVPVVLGTVNGIVLRRLERRWSSQAASTAVSRGAVAPR